MGEDHQRWKSEMGTTRNNRRGKRDKRRVLLHEIYEKHPDYFHQIFDSSSKESSPSHSDSSESKGMDLPDLRAILAMIDGQPSSDAELSEPEQHQKELPPPEPPPIFRDSLPPVTEEPRKVFRSQLWPAWGPATRTAGPGFRGPKPPGY